jgi:hypothetical protein
MDVILSFVPATAIMYDDTADPAPHATAPQHPGSRPLACRCEQAAAAASLLRAVRAGRPPSTARAGWPSTAVAGRRRAGRLAPRPRLSPSLPSFELEQQEAPTMAAYVNTVNKGRRRLNYKFATGH